MTRFAAPLAYNCLHVIRMHEYLPQGRRTVFAQKMRPAMADVPVFGTDFNTWFPLVITVYCTLLCARDTHCSERRCVKAEVHARVERNVELHVNNHTQHSGARMLSL